MTDKKQYSERVGQALAFAADVHSTQTRKGKQSEPYLSHVLTVAGLVAHYGGSEDQIIAGVLHDAAEDQGGEEMLAEIRNRFGAQVAAIVDDCSDALPAPGEQKPPWRERKMTYIESLKSPDHAGARLVEACDKVANLRDIVEDVQNQGPDFLNTFNGKVHGTVWYYTELGRVLMPQVPAQLRTEYERLLALLYAAVGPAEFADPPD